MVMIYHTIYNTNHMISKISIAEEIL